MLQACLLKTVTAASKDDDSDLEEHELLDRVDVKEWYEGEGERVITAMIDNLNTQGHRTLLIREMVRSMLSWMPATTRRLSAFKTSHHGWCGRRSARH